MLSDYLYKILRDLSCETVEAKSRRGRENGIDEWKRRFNAVPRIYYLTIESNQPSLRLANFNRRV